MATVTITWSNPDNGYGDLLTDIDEIEIFQIPDDVSPLFPKSGVNVTASQAKEFSDRTDSVSIGTVDYMSVQSGVSHPDQNAGTYTYGVFSKNDSGLGPGDIAVITVA